MLTSRCTQHVQVSNHSAPSTQCLSDNEFNSFKTEYAIQNARFQIGERKKKQIDRMAMCKQTKKQIIDATLDWHNLFFIFV